MINCIRFYEGMARYSLRFFFSMMILCIYPIINTATAPPNAAIAKAGVECWESGQLSHSGQGTVGDMVGSGGGTQ